MFTRMLAAMKVPAFRGVAGNTVKGAVGLYFIHSILSLVNKSAARESRALDLHDKALSVFHDKSRTPEEQSAYLSDIKAQLVSNEMGSHFFHTPCGGSAFWIKFEPEQKLQDSIIQDVDSRIASLNEVKGSSLAP